MENGRTKTPLEWSQGPHTTTALIAQSTPWPCWHQRYALSRVWKIPSALHRRAARRRKRLPGWPKEPGPGPARFLARLGGHLHDQWTPMPMRPGRHGDAHLRDSQAVSGQDGRRADRKACSPDRRVRKSNTVTTLYRRRSQCSHRIRAPQAQGIWIALSPPWGEACP